MDNQLTFIFMGITFFIVIGGIVYFNNNYNLNNIKAKTVGDGQHGTARFSSQKEIDTTLKKIPFQPQKWRNGIKLPQYQGILVGSKGSYANTTAYIDTDDVHLLMIGAAGVGKTSHFLYPNLEYACASGVSFLTTDTKGDLYRNYGGIAKEYYGYNVSVIDLRNPLQSDGNNMLHLVNKYMDIYKRDKNNLMMKAKTEKHAKIIAKTIIFSDGETASSYGQNSFFYDSAEGLLTSIILIVSEFCKPNERHIVSVFKVIQDLLKPSQVKGKTRFQMLLELLPDNHKAKWFAGSALNTGEQAMMSVLSTVLSRLNAFIDSEIEQILCFETTLDIETFCSEKSAIFLVMPEEDNTKHFLISLFIQQYYREMLAYADEHGGKLKNKVIMYLDEIGTIPRIESIEMMFSASRSRNISIVAIIQALAQLEKNYGKEGASIIVDNCQDTLFGGFAPNSESAKVMSENLGYKTVLSGSVSKGKNDPTQSLQMIQRPLMTTDELKSMPKGYFILMKTGIHPMKTVLKLFKYWGIELNQPFIHEVIQQRNVEYADIYKLEEVLKMKYRDSTIVKGKIDISKVLKEVGVRVE
ncbi:MAG: type IV secretory system conjugative DNA transfer family protein [Erysipelotrichales bacterium]|nr:type IV secretory system conjugative DNA transfer family protein [Erysipelotrichales bacterium]